MTRLGPVDKHAGRQLLQGAAQGQGRGHAEAVARQQTGAVVQFQHVQPPQGAGRGAAAHGVQENGQVRPAHGREQEAAGAVAERDVDHSRRKMPGQTRPLQGLREQPAEIVAGEGRTDAEDADGAHRRPTRTVRKWVAQEMQGS